MQFEEGCGIIISDGTPIGCAPKPAVATEVVWGLDPQRKKSRKNKKVLDKKHRICYNKDVKKRGQRIESQGNRKSPKKIKKGLDNSLNICYNKDVKKTNNKFKKERGSYYD